MSSIQGLPGLGAASFAPKVQAAPPQAAKTEASETPQQERAEALRGAQEAGERPSNPLVGSKFSATA